MRCYECYCEVKIPDLRPEDNNRPITVKVPCSNCSAYYEITIRRIPVNKTVKARKNA